MPRNGEARRLFHGRGRVFPGYQDLVIDSYGDLLWITLFAQRNQGWQEELRRTLQDLFPELACMVLQRRDLPGEEPRVLVGRLPVQPLAREAGLSYLLRPGAGQNLGFFIDMARGRELVRSLAAGKKVLNLFAYSCSFSVAALAGGAQQVVNVDMNRGALDLGRRNHQLNRLDLRRASFLPYEIFRSLSRLRKLGPFDLVICDPPYSQGRSFNAEAHWPKLVAKLQGLLGRRGEVVACLNAPQMTAADLGAIFARELPGWREALCCGAGDDFPVQEPRLGVTIQHFVPSVAE